MRILAVTFFFVPDSNTGGTWNLFQILKFLKEKCGHEVRVLHLGIKSNYEVDGIEVIAPIIHQNYIYQWSDIVLSQLDASNTAAINAAKANKTAVHFLHNTNNTYHIEGFANNSVVYTSDWMQEQMKLKFGLQHRWFKLNPYVDFDFYFLNKDPSENEYITLINLSYNKGGDIFNLIAQEMPDRKFLGVLGYDEQVTSDLPNLTIVPETSNIRDVYRKTRILLMPSRYESWGRTATEAMCNGIPVICTDLDPLRINCRDAALYVKNGWDTLEEYMARIILLDDREMYDYFSIAGQDVYAQQDHEKQMKDFNEWLVRIR